MVHLSHTSGGGGGDHQETLGGGILRDVFFSLFFSANCFDSDIQYCFILMYFTNFVKYIPKIPIIYEKKIITMICVSCSIKYLIFELFRV